MMVSRSAVAKWEADKGLPDIDNLKALAKLLNVSIDFLLDDGETLTESIFREPYNLSDYGKENRKKKKDCVIREKFPSAEIHTLPDEAMKNSMVAARGVYICNRLMDEKNFEEADRLMAHMLEIESGIVGIHRDLLICDRMYIELIRENRRDVIEEMQTKEQKKFMKSMKNLPSVLRTEYARALLSDNDTVKAEKIMEQFEKSAKICPYPGEAQSERELMEIAENIFSKTEQSTNLLKSHARPV